MNATPIAGNRSEGQNVQPAQGYSPLVESILKLQPLNNLAPIRMVGTRLSVVEAALPEEPLFPEYASAN